nr:hypothetical protein [Nocardioides perillae]
MHVGTPKTGTSYLQDVLFRNRELLEEHGVRYPAHRFDAHFLAALDLMRLPWGGLETEAVGAWDALAERVRDAEGTAVVSHEILATASRAQVERALTSLGHGRPGVEVHLVLSVRDLVRQLPAEWQENVKHRATLSFARFLDEVRDPARSSKVASWFWGVQEVPAILDRWGHALPPEHVHLVTVPAPGAPPDLLWQRFSHAFGLDDLPIDLHTDRGNPSLGVPETALVRRINQAVNRDVAPAQYRPLVRELLAHQTLSRRTGSPRLALPPEAVAWAQDLSRGWVEQVRDRGYDVVGDLEDLVGLAPRAAWSDPDAPAEDQVAGAAVDAVRALLLEHARRLETEEALRRELREAHEALERSYLRPSYRLREKVVRRLQSSGAGQRLLEVYRRVRGRSSRSA